jgi:hypothetical protein
MKTRLTTHRTFGARGAMIFFAAACLLLLAPTFEAQGLDICGCASVPGLQPFDSSNASTFPPGTSDSSGTLTIPLPPDGILKFSSFTLQNRHVQFVRNAANTPVTILVAGDVSMLGGGCCYNVSVSGADGSSGNSSTAGVGGLGGPGGFRGGDGASQAINGAAIGGPGFGPAGGSGGTDSPLATGGGGTFLGLPELIPLVGGSGGGGGASASNTSTSCSGGGGGGGGGAILIAANGTINLTNYQIFADGGSGAGSGNGNCASPGGGGSGGAIRLVANRLVQGASVNVLARGVNNGGTSGRIRLESVDTSAQTQFPTTPAALRIVGPTPLANPINPTVAITAIGGSAVAAVPQGTFGAIDVVLPAPGATDVSVATTGVPSGTTVAISVKPRIGGQAQSQTVPLGGCDTNGACGAAATFNLSAGAYVVEARATFQIP